MQKIFITAGMLALSNVFMTFAWYGHLKNFNSKPWVIAAILSWGIALFEYIIEILWVTRPDGGGQSFWGQAIKECG